MIVFCPHRHLSYAKWRLQVLRRLFCPSHLHSTLDTAADGNRRRPHRMGDHRSVSGSGITLARKRSSRSKNGIGDDEDALALLEDAARRTTSSRVIGPSRDLGPYPPSDGPANKILEKDPDPSPVPGHKKREEKTANTQLKTKKQIEEEEAGAFLREAAQRVITPPTPKQPKALAENQRRSISVTGTRKFVKEEEKATSLERGAEPLGEGWQSHLGRAPSSRCGDVASAREDIIGRSPPRDEGSVEELQSWFRQAAERARRHGQAVKSSTPHPDPAPLRRTPAVSAPNGAAQKRVPRRLEPWKFRAAKPINPTKLSHPIQNEGNHGYQFLSQQSGSKTNENVETPWNAVGDVDLSSESRLERPKESVSPSVNGPLSNSKSELPPMVQDISSSIEKRTLPASDCLEQSSSGPASAVPRRQTGPLSGFEHEQLSDLLSSLQSRPARAQNSAGKASKPQPRSASKISAQRPTAVKPILPGSHRFQHRRFARWFSPPSVQLWTPSSQPGPSCFEHNSLGRKLPFIQPGHSSPLRNSSCILHSAKSMDSPISEQKPQVQSFSASLPSSAYQRLQAQERRMKEQATGKAKQRLQDNPWAQWLASPIRMCQATGVRLPNKLMIGWNCVRNPKDDLVYLMPEELTDIKQLSTGNRTGSSPVINSGEGLVQETLSGRAMKTDSSQEPANTRTSDYSPQPAEAVDDQADGDSGKSSNVTEKSDPGQRKRENPIAPAKVYMRSSSTLVLELNNKMLAKRDGELMNDELPRVQLNKTNSSALSRLFSNRWKDQARKLEKSAEAKNPQSGFLTMQQMRNVRWYPSVHDVMLDLMRLRVLKALENVVVRNSRHTGTEKRITPLPSATEGYGFDEDAVSTKISGVEHAVFLYVGPPETSEAQRQYSQKDVGQSPQVPSLNPSTCHNFTLQFIPGKTPTTSGTPSPDNTRDQLEQAFIPTWAHSPLATHASESVASQQQQKYIPPTTALHIPHLVNSNNDDAAPTIRNLPVFDLPSLLGESYMNKLRSLLNGEQAVAQDILGFNRDDASGWLMVKGGARTKGFKLLVQEVWRLWLFLGRPREGWGETHQTFRGGAK
jgi:hypothetical protein